MANSITGKEYPLAKIFSSDFEYHIPPYQRPYAWGEEQTRALFDDLFDFYQTEKSDNYFLGSIVLIKKEGKPSAQVIDGQQRLTTLSILFSVLSYSLQDAKLKSYCKQYLQQEEQPFEDIDAHPRLFLRAKDQNFFNKYVQNVRINELLSLDPKHLETEAQVHIQINAHVLLQRLQESFENDIGRKNFINFLVTRCYLIAVSTATQDSAFRIFSVMNSRGLDLLPTDIIKSETIGKIPEEEQEDYTLKWEDIENMTGRDGFNEVFTHARTIFVKDRPRKNLLDEFKEYVVSQTSPKALIDDYLEPYARAYVQLKNCAYSSTQKAEDINGLLYWLNKTNNYDWMPSAIQFLSHHQNDSAYVLWFIRKLERLASYLLATAQDVNQRTARYKWVLVEMDNRPDSSLEHPLKNIELTDWEKKCFLQALDGEIYLMPPIRRNYLIQRLDSFVSDGGASYNAAIFTIEHVLPQHPSAGSEWMTLWPDVDQQKHWLNRIANLVPLTRQRNSEAQNYDFATKKLKYFQSKKGTSSYTLTSQVNSLDSWTPEVVKQRQEDLLHRFASNWDLDTEEQHDAEIKDYILAGRGAAATGRPEGNEGAFIVLKGSQTSDEITEGMPSNYKSLRSNLENDGTIENHFFTKDRLFPSASAAAAVILGRSSNGRKEWTTLDGRSIAQMGH